MLDARQVMLAGLNSNRRGDRVGHRICFYGLGGGVVKGRETPPRGTQLTLDGENLSV
jgi:hypothetical protein